MKYTIEGFSQEQMFNLGLDCNDAVILRWFIDFYFTGKMAKITNNEKEYVWVNFQSCLDDLPLLRITNREVLSRRFKKIVDCGLLESYVKRSGGTYTCYRIVEDKYKELVETKSTQKSSQIDSKVERGVDSKVDTKDSSIKLNQSIKYIIEYLNTACNKKYSFSKSNITLISNLMKKGYSVEDILKVIDIKKKQWINDEKMNQYLRPMTLFGSKFESYLNSDYTPPLNEYELAEIENEKYLREVYGKG